MTNMMTMPVVAIEWMSGASRLRTVSKVPESGCRTSTGISFALANRSAARAWHLSARLPGCIIRFNSLAGPRLNGALLLGES